MYYVRVYLFVIVNVYIYVCNASSGLVSGPPPPLNNTYTLFKVGRKKRDPQGKKSTLQ